MTDRLSKLARAADVYGFLLDERDQEIRRQHANGAGASELARLTGLTRQRVHQIINQEETR